MNSNFVKPGIAALLLAILFPIYWSCYFIFGDNSGDYLATLRADMITTTWLDGLFLIIGILELYIYLSLIRSFNEQLNSALTKTLIMLLAATIVVFHGTVFADLYLTFSHANMTNERVETWVESTLFIGLSALTIYTIVGILLGIVLLINKQGTAQLLKYFGLLLLIVCLLQITLLFAVVNLALFPAALVVLALYFFKEPDSLEVI